MEEKGALHPDPSCENEFTQIKGAIPLNRTLKNLIETHEPKIKSLDEKEQARHKAGILLLGAFISETFLDLPLLPEDKYGTDGLFYNIPFLHDDMLYLNGRTQTLLVVYRIQDRASECPLRIEFEMTDHDKKEYMIHVYDQSGERTEKYTIVERENGEHYTSSKELLDMTLSEMVAHFA